MFVKAKSLKELPLLSVLQGKKIADIKDVIYDPFENKVVALLLYPTGVLSKEKYVLYQDLRSIGKDAVIVDSSLVVKKPEEVDKNILNLRKKDRLILGTKVVTEDGEQLGTVTDYLFDSLTGTVKQLELSQGGFADFKSGRKLISIKNLISMGPDATIVSVGTADEIAEPANTQTWQGSLATENIEENTQNIKTKFENVKDKLTSYFQPIPSQKPQAELPQNETTLTPQKDQPPIVIPQTFENRADYQPEPTETKHEPILTYPKTEPTASTSPKTPAQLDYEQTLDKLRALSQKTQEKVVELKNQAQVEFNKPENQARYQSLKQNFENTKASARDKFSQYQTVAYNEISRVKGDKIEQKKNNAVGLFLTKTILDDNDNVLAQRGDIITHKLISQAEQLGILDQILKNTSYDPIT